MDEQKKKNINYQNKKTDVGGGGGKNNTSSVTTVVLKVNLYCEGCASKVLRRIRSFDGVDSATVGEWQKITVVGKVDPAKLREKVEQKTHKKVELVFPHPKKETNNNNSNNGNDKEKAKGKENKGSGDIAKQEKTREAKDKDPNNKSNGKKSKEKELPLTTTVLKVHLHCEGCIQKIHKIITKTKGCKDVKIDKRKEFVTVTGAMDIKALTDVLKKHLKRDVEIVRPKKELADKKENIGGQGDKAGKNNGGSTGDEGKKSGGDDNEGKKKSGGKGEDDGESASRSGDKDKNKNKNKMTMEGNDVMQFHIAQPYPHQHPISFMYGLDVGGDQFHYNPYAVAPYHAPQIFSDENPNACSVM